MFEKIGGCLVALACMSADSIDISVPFLIGLLGMVLVVIGEWRSFNG